MDYNIEQNNQTSEPMGSGGSGWVIGVIILILVLGGIYYWKSQSVVKSEPQVEGLEQSIKTSPNQDGNMDGNGNDVRTDMSTTTPSVTPTQAADNGAMDSNGVKVFEVHGGSFYFSPSEIRVKKGDKIKITLVNDGGFHDFVLDEFNVKTDRISAGQTTSVEFTADKTGTFEYYCSVGEHRAMGMKGNLIVE